MQQIEIKENEAGQRLDKFLHKFMPLAPARSEERRVGKECS